MSLDAPHPPAPVFLPTPTLRAREATAERTPLMVLYRGPLTSCNYDCAYCPFAKAHDSPATLGADRRALERFVLWATHQTQHHLTVLFTPWGEALTRSWYRTAMVTLSHLPHVERVAVQTNAAVRMEWTRDADLTRLALWTTYHPDEITHDQFLAKALELRERAVRFSVGVVGLPAHLAAARSMRTALPDDVYLWANAAEGHIYDDVEAAQWSELDPHFGWSRSPHPSAGRPCSAGRDAITVDGDGVVRRCHFLPDHLNVIGRLYDDSYLEGLQERSCPAASCECHIGYLHLDHLGLREVFAGGWAERVPATRLPSAPGLGTD